MHETKELTSHHSKVVMNWDVDKQITTLFQMRH